MTLTVEEAEAHIRRTCFAYAPPGRTGVELEWLVHDPAEPGRAVAPERLDGALAALDQLPRGGGLSREPGGQVELSTAPAASLPECVEAAAADLAAVRRALARAGLALLGQGLDPSRGPRRVVDHPRYRAMDSYFAADGPWGRVMMCATAAVQVNVECGLEQDYRRRWALAHRLGPVLVAAFANSPLWRGRPTGWRSTRQALWARIDPGRTRPPHHHPAGPRAAWSRYALDARLMCLPRSAPAEDWAAPRGVTFRSWLDGASRCAQTPTLDDLDYHLGTLFPPVRPRGWLELRMIDAQRGDDWIAATAVPATLLDDPAAAEAAWRATAPLCPDGMPQARVWARAARLGPADPALGAAVRSCFAAARAALAPGPVRDAVADFAARYAERGRCPADDRLDELRTATRVEGARSW
ncbi:ergothioneine biosynthesis glutamate--cysteine ligase EgtA [Streptomyces sp. 6N223]|uniref:ergothioneine biosynthesis glutamate--cysteine ligase EgtA n=1 Tax=Streptomyces sp. 6N223 TaxID=3457412 RepID=UPI003FCF14D4